MATLDPYDEQSLIDEANRKALSDALMGGDQLPSPLPPSPFPDSGPTINDGPGSELPGPGDVLAPDVMPGGDYGTDPWMPTRSETPIPTAPPDATGGATAPPATTTPGAATAAGVYTSDPNSSAYRATTTASSSSAFPKADPLNDALRSYVMSTVGMDPWNVSINDPSLAPVQNAFELSSQRTLDRNRAAMAERLAASGQSGGGAMDAWLSNAGQSMAETNATHAADVVMQRQQQKLGQLQSALATGAGLLTADQENQLRLEIARMQNELGQGQLGYQYSALGQADDQFYANLNDYLLQRLAAEINGQIG